MGATSRSLPERDREKYLSANDPTEAAAGPLPEESARAAAFDESVPFSLSRWFATVGLISILALATICALLLSKLFTDKMLLQEGRLTMQFVQSIIDVEDASAYFASDHAANPSYMEELLAHISGSPDVLRANLYSRGRTILWSSDPSIIGRSFAGSPNSELDAALRGDLEVHQEDHDEPDEEKAEHANLRAADGLFVEIYVPVWDQAREKVVGAVELYRAPQLLQQTIARGKRIIWVGAIGAGLLLYLALLPLVRRADSLIRAQHDQIVEARTLAAVGDLGSAVAHGIRNPLAVIRSSAEIVRDVNEPRATREAASDIMNQVDRLEHWVRGLLTYVHLPPGESHPVDIEALSREIVTQFGTELRRNGIEATVDFAGSLPRVQGDPILLGQVLSSLLANAVEAMPRGGRLQIEADSRAPGWLALRIVDTGSGMTDEQLRKVFKPFHTTKPQGLGIGLPLARRIIERMRGNISLSSERGAGTTVTINLPTTLR